MRRGRTREVSAYRKRRRESRQRANQPKKAARSRRQRHKTMPMSTSVVTRECTVARKMMPATSTSAANANMYLRLRSSERRWESWAGVAIVDGDDVDDAGGRFDGMPGAGGEKKGVLWFESKSQGVKRESSRGLTATKNLLSEIKTTSIPHYTSIENGAATAYLNETERARRYTQTARTREEMRDRS
jgi:hypothetical protein